MNEKMTSYALQTIYQFVMNNTRLWIRGEKLRSWQIMNEPRWNLSMNKKTTRIYELGWNWHGELGQIINQIFKNLS